MSSKRILTISVVISLFGHLIVLSAFSWNRAGEMKKKIAPTQVSFWGELPEEERRESLNWSQSLRSPRPDQVGSSLKLEPPYLTR